MRIHLPIAVASILLIGCASSSQPTTDADSEVELKPYTSYAVVSIYRLLGSPDEFSGEEIGTVGYLRIGRGDFNVPVGYLFASLQDWRDDVRLNSLELYFPMSVADSGLTELILKVESRDTPTLVMIFGEFIEGGTYFGGPSFRNVSKVEEWHQRRK